MRIEKSVLDVREVASGVEVRSADGGLKRLPDEAALRRYFDLDRDLEPVYAILREDPRLLAAYGKFRGLRILRQDSWEALAGFILSSNNHLPRIKKIWHTLCVEFHKNPFEFPSPEEIARSSDSALRGMGLGYRAPYLFKSAQRIAANSGRYLILSGLDDAEAKERLMELEGIGPKVAECALLYGFGRLTAFPVDVWIHRALKILYWKGRRRTVAQAERFGKRRWKEHAGYIQQYLFHAARMGIIGR